MRVRERKSVSPFYEVCIFYGFFIIIQLYPYYLRSCAHNIGQGGPLVKGFVDVIFTTPPVTFLPHLTRGGDGPILWVVTGTVEVRGFGRVEEG